MATFQVLKTFGFDYIEQFSINGWNRLAPEIQTEDTYYGINYQQRLVGSTLVPTSTIQDKVELHGTGLGGYQSYGPTIGTITSISANLNDQWLFEITDAALSASDYNRIVRDAATAFGPFDVRKANDQLISAALTGDNTILGTDSRDRIPVFGTTNFIDGGADIDSVTYNTSSVAVRAFHWNDQIVAFNTATRQLDNLVSVETLQFTDRYLYLETIPDARPLEYLATYADLRAAFGTDEVAGFDHFQRYGIVEGRSPSFDGLDYIVSYDDLIAALPHTNDAGATHFIENGAAEGRRVLFDPVQYIASYDDLVRAFSTRVDLKVTTAAEHYLEYGISEGRARDAFDARQYLANYADLRAAFGSDEHAAAEHYILNGYAEGRSDSLL